MGSKPPTSHVGNDYQPGSLSATQRMKSDDSHQILAWLRTRPDLPALRAAYPEIWEETERELGKALSERDHARLHVLLNPPKLPQRNRNSTPSRREQAEIVHSAILQRMTALAVEQHSLAIATGQTSGKVRFNLFNGLIAQRLLFERNFERKPVAKFWFSLLWPLVWQKRFLMPLVERKGIYCFYSRELVNQLTARIGKRTVLEIAAGDGTLSRFLHARGVQITATDDHSWPDKIRYPASVLRMDAISSLRKFAPQVVICSWPPARNTFEREVFRSKSVEMYIVISSQHQFASGNWIDYQAQTQFDLEVSNELSQLVLPPELGSQVLVFTRRLAHDPDKPRECNQ